MPIFTDDIKSALYRTADSSIIRRVFGNPFISAGMVTVCIFIVLVMMSSTLNIAEVGKISLVVYIMSVALMFFNNRILMDEIKVIGGNGLEITPVRDIDIVGAADDTVSLKSAHVAPERVHHNSSVADHGYHYYSADFLDS